MFEKQSINNSKRNVKSIFQRRLFSKGNFNSIHKNKSKKNNIKIFSIRNRILDKKIPQSTKNRQSFHIINMIFKNHFAIREQKIIKAFNFFGYYF